MNVRWLLLGLSNSACVQISASEIAVFIFIMHANIFCEETAAIFTLSTTLQRGMILCTVKFVFFLFLPLWFDVLLVAMHIWRAPFSNTVHDQAIRGQSRYWTDFHAGPPQIGLDLNSGTSHPISVHVFLKTKLSPKCQMPIWSDWSSLRTH